MVTDNYPAADLLSRAYDELDFSTGALFETSDSPSPRSHPDEWQNVGDWLMLAQRMGAERVFFVGDDPVILFARLPGRAVEADILTSYRRAWSLTRPMCLFLATDDELRVYSLSAPPVRSIDERQALQPLEIVTRAADVADQLAEYHRERIEAGALFDDSNFRSRGSRADVRLLNDVKLATGFLRDRGLTRPIAHALIERIILIRYLEDRGVITGEYFEDIAASNPTWQSILQNRSDAPIFGARSIFATCLANKRFTYTIFRQLATDFNGDLFVVSVEESNVVADEHMEFLQRLFTGAGLQDQDHLFLWAYDFSVVPTSLISSMYEQFYHAGTDDESGTYYTPPELVEYVLSQTLTDDILKGEPRVCDPACGSGIFLVEAFRRIVRYEIAKSSEGLSSAALRELLLQRVAGIDMNAEAVQLAAFSLYLAYLNYQRPSDIREAGPLPRLIRRSNERDQPTVLVIADAFSSTQSEAEPHSKPDAPLPWPSNSFDLIVGNPPWDEPRGKTWDLADEWATLRELPIGERSRSQLFLWRALSLVKQSGIVALLVNATALHNTRQTSKAFRRQWLRRVRLLTITNFTPAREVFFRGGIAPFFLLKFGPKSDNLPENLVEYRTIRPSSTLTSSRSVSFGRAERRWVNQDALVTRDYLWKTYAWGNQHDDALMARLDAEVPLRDFLPTDPKPGYGYQRGSAPPSALLASLRSLRTFKTSGLLERSWFEPPPAGVKRQPDERLYSGQRILIARGVSTEFGPKARLELQPFSFRHTIYCLPVASLPAWRAKCILGVLLSSLGRYRIFMTNGSWGVWHDSLVPSDILDLPMRLIGARTATTRQIVRAVDQLQRVTDLEPSLFSSAPSVLSDVLGQIDDAVFELFELSEGERDLVRDFHAQTLDIVSNKARSRALLPLSVGPRDSGRIVDLESDSGLEFRNYLRSFLARWNRELGADGELSWRLITSPRSPLIAAVFETQSAGELSSQVEDMSEWRDVLARLSSSLEEPVDATIRTEGVIRSVSDTSIIVVKRNESRLWTASAAREDAEATMLQAMALRGT